MRTLAAEVVGSLENLVHAAHAARATRTAALRSALLLVFLDVGDQSFGGEHQAGDGSGVLQREAGDLGRVDDARLDQVAVLAGVGVEAEVVVLRLADLADDHGAFVAGVVRDLPSGLFERALHDVDANSFVVVQLELLERR